MYEKRILCASELTDAEEESYNDEKSSTKTYKIKSFKIFSTPITNDEIGVT